MARAWKSNYDKLGDSEKERLIKSNVHNYEREMTGLNKGTEGIAKKYNADIVSNEGFKKALATNSFNSPEVKNYLSSGAFTKGQINTYIREGVHKNQYLTSLDYSGNGRSAMTFGDFKKYRGLPGYLIRESGIKKVKDNAYLDAIARRHEADEVRYGTKSEKKKKFHMEVDGANQSTTKYVSHLTPRVLVDESKHTAIAPKDVKDFYTNLRTISGEKAGLETLGVKYGEKAKHIGSLGRKAEKFVSNANKKATIEWMKLLKG